MARFSKEQFDPSLTWRAYGTKSNFGMVEINPVMKTTFTTTIWKDKEMNATALQVPADAVAALGKGKRHPVKVSLNGYTYRTTIAVMGGMFMLPLNAENRDAAGVKAGDEVEIALELDTEPRTVVVPEDLAAPEM